MANLDTQMELLAMILEKQEIQIQKLEDDFKKIRLKELRRIIQETQKSQKLNKRVKSSNHEGFATREDLRKGLIDSETRIENKLDDLDCQLEVIKKALATIQNRLTKTNELK